MQGQLVRVATELKAAQTDVEDANVALRSVLAENRQLKSDLALATTETADPPIEETGNRTTLAELTPLEPLVESPPKSSTIAISPMPISEPDELDPSTKLTMPVAKEDPSVDPINLVADAVERWRNAWSSQDIDGYLAAYAPSFLPQNGLSLARWQQDRRLRVAEPDSIEVALGTLRIEEIAPGQARVRFTQDYRANTFSDHVEKTLTLEWTSEANWLIISEVSTAP